MNGRQMVQVRRGSLAALVVVAACGWWAAGLAVEKK